MLMSIIIWLIGMVILKDYGYDSKENLSFSCLVLGVFELIFYVIIVLKLVGGCP